MIRKDYTNGNTRTGPAALRSAAITAGIFLAVLAAVSVLCSLVGTAQLSWDIFKVHVSRAVIAATVGAGLAVAGMALQGMLRNPLAEPYVLGISSGAGVGVLLGLALAPVMHMGEWASKPLLAFAGASVTCLVVYGVAQRRGRLDPYVLLLSGVIVNVLNGAVMLAILMFLNPQHLIDFIGWGMGHVPEYYWAEPRLIIVCAAFMVACWIVLFVRGAAFNTLGLGDDVAASSGVRVHWLRVETFALVSVMTAAAVSLAGPIGFVGLIVPHVCRLIVGPDHRRLAVYSGFVGALFLVLGDTFCRVSASWIGIGTVEIPLGIITALCGGPFFIFLLRRRFKETGT